LNNDRYHTIRDAAEGLYKEKGSKFIAIAFPVRDEEEIKHFQDELRKSHHAARHHCYAWKLGMDENNYRANDDGEPGNSAGKPILGQIQKYELTNILIVVVRYFGGTKLGVGGLINAYRSAAEDALHNATIVEKQLHNHYQLLFSYAEMNEVMTLVKEWNLEQYDQQFELSCTMKIAVAAGLADELENRLSDINGLKHELLYTV